MILSTYKQSGPVLNAAEDTEMTVTRSAKCRAEYVAGGLSGGTELSTCEEAKEGGAGLCHSETEEPVHLGTKQLEQK